MFYQNHSLALATYSWNILDSKNTWTTLLDSDWSYDVLKLDLKST